MQISSFTEVMNVRLCTEDTVYNTPPHILGVILLLFPFLKCSALVGLIQISCLWPNTHFYPQNFNFKHVSVLPATHSQKKLF